MNTESNIGQTPESQHAAIAPLQEVFKCQPDSRFGSLLDEPWVGPVVECRPSGTPADKAKLWQARTITLTNSNGTQKHVLLPFIINTGGHCLLGNAAFGKCLEYGARSGFSRLEDFLRGVEHNLPTEDQTVQLAKVPEGHWLDQGESDIRNNLIGGVPAAAILVIDGDVRQRRSEAKEVTDAMIEKLPIIKKREYRLREKAPDNLPPGVLLPDQIQ